MDIVEAFRTLAAPLLHRVKNATLRGVVVGVDNTKKAQTLRIELLGGDVISAAENLAGVPGVTSVTRNGAEVVVQCVGGMRDHPLVIAVSDRASRPKDGSGGDLIIYHVDEPGTRIHLKAGGGIEIVASAGVDITGDLRVSGTIDAGGDITGAGEVADQKASMSADRLIFDAHVHKENGKGGGVVDPTFTPQS